MKTVPYFIPSIGEEENRAVAEVMDSGWLTTGPVAQKFEVEFAKAVDSPYALAVTSCTAALHLALEAVGIGRGDFVLVPALTFAATAEVVRYLGANPVFVDSQANDLNVSLADARDLVDQLRAQGHSPKALIVVHYGGCMVDMEAASVFAREHGLFLIEDAAHAFPAQARRSNGPGIMPGELSDAACFSFYANKTMTTGEGGMLVTRREEIFKRAKVMRLHGIDRDAYDRYTARGSWYYDIVAAGYKYNLPDILAAIGRVQLRRAEELRAQRETVAGWYHQALSGCRGVRCLSFSSAAVHAWHLFPVVLDPAFVGDGGRNRLIEFMRFHGITTSVHWTALHRMTYYRKHHHLSRSLPVASSASDHELSLPLYPTLSYDAVTYVAEIIRTFIDDQSTQ